MGSVYKKPGSRFWYLRFKDATGKTKNKSSGCTSHRQAERLLVETERAAAVGETAGPMLGPATVTSYAKGWIERRRGRVRSVADEETRLRLHVLPRIGSMPLDEVRPRHLRDLVLALRAEGKLAARTIRSINGSLHTMFRDAVIDELIPVTHACFRGAPSLRTRTRIPSGGSGRSSPAPRSRS